MTLLILAIVIALVAWALRLMEQAIEGQEFSLMLAGFLVASSAAAMMGVYFLMGNYLIYVNQLAPVTSGLSADLSIADSDDVMPSWLVQASYDEYKERVD
jgi:hypothetical protein